MSNAHKEFFIILSILFILWGIGLRFDKSTFGDILTIAGIVMCIAFSYARYSKL